MIGDLDGNLAILDVASGEELEHSKASGLQSSNSIQRIVVSNDERFVACGLGGKSVGSLQVWDRSKRLWVLQHPTASKPSSVWLDDSHLLTGDGETSELEILDVSDGNKLTSTHVIPADGVREMAWLRANESVVLVAEVRRGDFVAAQVEVRDVTTWSQVLHCPLGMIEASSLAVSEDGNLVAVGDIDGGITLIDVVKGEVAAVNRGHASKVFSLEFSH